MLTIHITAEEFIAALGGFALGFFAGVLCIGYDLKRRIWKQED